MNLKNISFINVLITTFLFFLLLIFAFIAIDLRPLSHWANYQITCIENESVDKTIPWAVRKCNGRSKVYQVK